MQRSLCPQGRSGHPIARARTVARTRPPDVKCLLPNELHLVDADVCHGRVFAPLAKQQQDPRLHLP